MPNIQGGRLQPGVPEFRDLGYLPGDVKEKIEPYMQPLFDNLDVIKNKFSPTSKDYQKIEEIFKYIANYYDNCYILAKSINI